VAPVHTDRLPCRCGASITALPFLERRGYETVAGQERVLRGVRLTSYRVRKPLGLYPRVVL
jgi:hypothetical protein